MNPGLAYVGDKYQVAMEAIVPLNNTAGAVPASGRNSSCSPTI
jgi:hypothetical protein